MLPLFDGLPLPSPRQTRDRVLQQLAKQAGHRFVQQAQAFILGYLQAEGPTSGEALTRVCKFARIVPPKGDDRSFGPVFYGLAKQGRIEKAGTCPRDRGNRTAGGNIWRLTKEQ